MRIGLANMPLLLALDILSPYEFFLLTLLKILGQGIIGGMILSHVFLFSIAGTLSSALVMFGLRRLLGKKLIGFAGLGCAGAVVSNCAQLVLARYLIFGPALRYLAGPFLASGVVTGVTLGVVCGYFCKYSAWYSQQSSTNTSGINAQALLSDVHTLPSSPSRCEPLVGQVGRVRLFLNNINAQGLFVTGLLMVLIFLFSRSLKIRTAQFIFFCLLAVVFGKKINLFATVLFSAGIVFFHLLAPFGKVLAVLGPLRITQGGLYAGIDKAVTISGLVIITRLCVKNSLKLPGTIGSLMGESARILELLRERRGMIYRKRIINSLDRIMLEMETINLDEPTDDTSVNKQKLNVKSAFLLCAMALITLGIKVLFDY